MLVRASEKSCLRRRLILAGGIASGHKGNNHRGKPPGSHQSADDRSRSSLCKACDEDTRDNQRHADTEPQDLAHAALSALGLLVLPCGFKCTTVRRTTVFGLFVGPGKDSLRRPRQDSFILLQDGWRGERTFRHTDAEYLLHAWSLISQFFRQAGIAVAYRRRRTVRILLPPVPVVVTHRFHPLFCWYLVCAGVEVVLLPETWPDRSPTADSSCHEGNRRSWLAATGRPSHAIASFYRSSLRGSPHPIGTHACAIGSGPCCARRTAKSPQTADSLEPFWPGNQRWFWATPQNRQAPETVLSVVLWA